MRMAAKNLWLFSLSAIALTWLEPGLVPSQTLCGDSAFPDEREPSSSKDSGPPEHRTDSGITSGSPRAARKDCLWLWGTSPPVSSIMSQTHLHFLLKCFTFSGLLSRVLEGNASKTSSLAGGRGQAPFRPRGGQLPSGFLVWQQASGT